MNTSFDVKRHINNEYKNSSIFDLKDALVTLSNRIKSKQQESKRFVSQNFDQFIEARQVIDSISKHIDLHDYLHKIDLEYLQNNFVIQKTDYNILQSQKFIQEKFKDLFQLENSLHIATSDREFVDLNEKAYKCFKNAINSFYLRQIWEKTHALRMNFLDEMCGYISSENSSLEDVILYFEYYFRIYSLIKEKNFVFDNSKVENTLLTTTKVKLKSIFIDSDCISTAFRKSRHFIMSFFALKIKFDLKINLIDSLCDSVLKNLYNQPDHVLFSLKREISTLNDVLKKMHEDVKVIDYFWNKMENVFLKMSEISLYRFIDDKKRLTSWLRSFIGVLKICESFFESQNTTKLDTIVKKIILNRINKSNLEETQDIQAIFAHSGVKIFKNNSRILKEIEFAIDKKLEEEMRAKLYRIREDFGIFMLSLEKAQRPEFHVPLIMSKISKLYASNPSNFQFTLTKISDLIQNNVCKYFLRNIVIEYKNVVLNADENAVFQKFRRMFSYLEEGKFKDNQTNKSSPQNFTNTEDKNNYPDDYMSYRIDKKSMAQNIRNKNYKGE